MTRWQWMAVVIWAAIVAALPVGPSLPDAAAAMPSVDREASMAAVRDVEVARVEPRGAEDATPLTQVADSAGCQPRNTTVTSPYPVSGYWIFQRRDPCDIRSTVEAIHQLGGDTLLTFGPRLTERVVSADGEVLDRNGMPDEIFDGCVVNGRTCYDDAVADLVAIHPDNDIIATYAYSSLERYGTSLLRCGLDRELVETVDRVYYRLLVPDSDPGSCPDPATTFYRLVLVASAPTDWLGTLLTEADAYEVGVYAGLPTSPTHDAPESWRPNLTHLSLLNELTRRVLTDYANRLGGHQSFKGLYQSFETPLKRATYPDIVTLYAEQHALASQILPDRRMVVSPYWDARRGSANGTPPDQVKSGFKQVALTGVDVVAPQDSRGTGKVGLFWPYDANKPVDSRLAVPSTGISPGTTYGDAYYGSTTAFFKAAAEARDELLDENVAVELWANLEAFEPTAPDADSCGEQRTLTDKARMDHAVTFIRAYASKVISFMWDGRYTCTPSGGVSLAEQINQDFDRPIASLSFKWRSSRVPESPLQDGIVVRGYSLEGSTVHLTWYDRNWALRSQDVVVAEVGWFDPDTGANMPKFPQGLQSIWVPFSWTDMAPNFWVHISITNETGKRTTHRNSLDY